MSFQFPADPKDGDVVVRTVNGVNIKGTYNETTNTWEVGELPEEPGVPGPMGPMGPQGDKGEPGQNLNVSGIVNTVNDLPPANDHILQFYVVADTNELYYSDGATWYNLGSPIQGPAGDGLTSVVADDQGSTYTITFAGTKPEFNFTTPNLKGQNGAPGQGWYDTQIVDQRPLNYQITFLSNYPDLQFTTDNIMGPQGETGSLVQASATVLGGIKIGRGLSITPSGVVSAGVTAVDLETTPVDRGNQLAYKPQFSTFTSNAEYGQLGKWEGGLLQEEEVEFTMPPVANRASVYVFSAGGIRPHPDFPNINDYFYAFRGYYVHRFTVIGGQYQGLNKSSLGWISTHNMGILSNIGTISSRFSNTPVSKFDVVEFAPGATIKFKYEVENIVSANLIFSAPPPRIVVIPFRTNEEGDIYDLPENNGIITQGDSFYFNNEVTNRQVFDESFPDIPDISNDDDDVNNLKYVIETTTEKINAELTYTNSPRLIEIRDELRAVRDLPGTIEEIQDLVYPLVEESSALMDYTFRFEVP